MDFDQNFRICLPQNIVQLIRFLGYMVATVAMVMLLNFGVLHIVGVQQPKLMHGFSSDFQDMFNQRGSKAD